MFVKVKHILNLSYRICMLCYVMLCYVMLCYVMLWYGMVWYGMVCMYVSI